MSDLSESLITHVRVQGFRSLRDVRVDLGNLTVLVGPNGSGKSTFLDALAFLREGLDSSLHEAFQNRGGVDQVRTRTETKVSRVCIVVSVRSRDEGRFRGEYSVCIQPRPQVYAFTVEEEACTVYFGTEQVPHRFVVKRNRWAKNTEGIQPSLAWNRLALPLLSGIRYFEPIYTALMSMRFYAIDPKAVATPNEQAEMVHLAPDGGNAANVLRNLRSRDAALYETVIQWMGVIVPGIRGVTAKTRGRQVTISFEEAFGDDRAVSLAAPVMSEGTLRALALLLAAYQVDPPALIGLEEPDTALYPGTAEALAEILSEAALSSQLLVTTHSADLVTHLDVADLHAVARGNGETVISTIDATQQQIARDGLFDLGELHRFEGLRPAVEATLGTENGA